MDTKKIKITLKWATLMPAMMDALQSNDLTEDSRRVIRDELMKLARAVDALQEKKEEIPGLRFKCPVCGSTRLTKHLSEDIELAYECKDCYWVGLQPEED